MNEIVSEARVLAVEFKSAVHLNKRSNYARVYLMDVRTNGRFDVCVFSADAIAEALRAMNCGYTMEYSEIIYTPQTVYVKELCQ